MSDSCTLRSSSGAFWFVCRWLQPFHGPGRAESRDVVRASVGLAWDFSLVIVLALRGRSVTGPACTWPMAHLPVLQEESCGSTNESPRTTERELLLGDHRIFALRCTWCLASFQVVFDATRWSAAEPFRALATLHVPGQPEGVIDLSAAVCSQKLRVLEECERRSPT